MIAIIEYKAGNTASVKNAVTRLGYECIITADKKIIQSSAKVILPGVGSAGMAMQELKKQGLDAIIKEYSRPLLGICLGMQLLCTYSAEDETKCLDLFNVNTKKFPAGNIVPHTGWNTLYHNSSSLLEGVPSLADVYFVHSYYIPLCKDTVSTCNYILPFSACLKKNNFYGTQFHPEKSGDIGQVILKNFLSL